MAENKKRRTEADRNYDTVKSIKSEILYWVGRSAFKCGWSFEKVMEWREKNIFSHPRYKKLTRADVAELSAVFDVILEQLQAKLFWTHVLDGKRVLTHDPVTKDRAIEVYEQGVALEQAGKAASAYCYAFKLPDDRLMLVPFREDDREKELESGRITEHELNLIYDQKTVVLPVAHLPNGKPSLSTVQYLTVEDGFVKNI